MHAGLAPSGVKGGERFVVDGDYEYYHYMQARRLPHGQPGIIIRDPQSWMHGSKATDPCPPALNAASCIPPISNRP